jgi:hypothetical protein
MHVFFVSLFTAAWGIFQLSGGCHHILLDLCFALMDFSSEGSFTRHTYVTRDLGLYSLIRKTDTYMYVLQWDSNPQHKNHYIFASSL